MKRDGRFQLLRTPRSLGKAQMPGSSEGRGLGIGVFWRSCQAQQPPGGGKEVEGCSTIGDEGRLESQALQQLHLEMGTVLVIPPSTPQPWQTIPPPASPSRHCLLEALSSLSCFPTQTCPMETPPHGDPYQQPAP